jgi:hypothetical protein
MDTQCTGESFLFQPHFVSENGKKRRKSVAVRFDGGAITSDGGGLLIRELEEKLGIIKRFAECFVDHRNPGLIDHTVSELLAQRVYGIALSYEDLNDHEDLRCDPLLALLVGKKDMTGEERKRKKDRGKPLAGKSTLNRLELTPEDADSKSRYKKIVYDSGKIDEAFVDIMLQAYPKPPKRIVLDLDATDDPLHGRQEGRFFHGYYDCYCYLPLYIFCGDFLLCARLRRSNIDASEGAVEELERMVDRIRKRWKKTEICIRGDSGFAREEIMAWCEANKIHYILGLPKNDRLKEALSGKMLRASKMYEEEGKASRLFQEIKYRTLESWTRTRRVVGKAEHLEKGPNPRFVVTSYSRNDYDARTLYEKEYCARGEMENRIKEQQLYLFADRTSTKHMRSNQLRLYLSAMAYVLLEALRRIGLKGTEMENAQCNTIRLRLLKIGGLVRTTVRWITVSLAGAYPYRLIFAAAYSNIRSLAASPA